jgi:hypothetical protein
MTSADRNDLMPAQEKLEWVTPKISLMEAGETLGNKLRIYYKENRYESPS